MSITQLWIVIAFAAFGLAMLGAGVYIGAGFARASQLQDSLIARFDRDEDVDDVADMGTDSEQ